MSYWTHVRGYVMVESPGKTQAHSRFIIETVLSHLPRVSGSEGDMQAHIVQRAGHNISCNLNEFGEYIPGDFHEIQSKYLIMLDGDLRDTYFDETKRAVVKWLARISKRLWLTEILVEVSGFDGVMCINDPAPFSAMFENWSKPDSNATMPISANWCEFMFWDTDEDLSEYPKALRRKYIDKLRNLKEAACV